MIKEIPPLEQTHVLFICSKKNGHVVKEEVEFFDSEDDSLEAMGMMPLYDISMEGCWLEVWEIFREYEYDKYKACGGYTLELVRLVKEERRDENAFKHIMFNSLVLPFLAKQ